MLGVQLDLGRAPCNANPTRPPSAMCSGAISHGFQSRNRLKSCADGMGGAMYSVFRI